MFVTLYVCNIVTDFYLISIPLPILFESNIRPRLKIGLCFLFFCAIFIIIAASVRLALVMTVYQSLPKCILASGRIHKQTSLF